jgi:intracellular septation protein
VADSSNKANAGENIGGAARLLIDLGPLLVFLAAYWAKGIFFATATFMVATAGAMIFSKVRGGHISPMLWFSGVMVLVMGALTLWLRDETFIKIKPTLYYGMVSAILFFGLWSKRPTLKLVLGTAYPGLSEKGWTLLSRNWAFFFIAMAGANELVWRTSTTDFWLGYKLWGALPATIIFAAANVPMLMRHGLGEEKAAETAVPPPQG